jgi:biotin carboxyl carrier protein
VNGKAHTVAVKQNSKDKFQVNVGNEFFQLEPLNRTGISTWVVRFRDDSIRVKSEVIQADTVNVWLACTPFKVSIQSFGAGGYPVSVEGLRQQAPGAIIRAQIPGRVTSIIVEEGDEVESGAPLLILEAMKMQNEITAPVKGHVKSIKVKEGETVKKDGVLVEIA